MTHLKVLVAAALAIGSVGLVGCKDDGRTVGQKVDDATAKTAQATKDAANKTAEVTKDAANKTAEVAKDAKDAVVAKATPSGSSDPTGMRGAMEGIVQNALDNNNFKTLTNHLVDADKKRLEAPAVNLTDLNAAIDQFKKNWQNKYNDPAFGAQDKDKVYAADFVALQAADGQVEGKQGTAIIKASHGMPDLTLTFVSQGGKWRLDVPDTATAEQLNQNLAAAVKELNKDPSTWPADKNDAVRLVSHKILAVVSGQAGGSSNLPPAGTQ